MSQIKKNYCTICDEQFHSDDAFTLHRKKHGQINELMSPDDSDFIPHIEINQDTGLPKPKPFKQKPYEPLTDYGG